MDCQAQKYSKYLYSSITGREIQQNMLEAQKMTLNSKFRKCIFVFHNYNKLTMNLYSRILESILTGKGTVASFNNGLKPGGGL